jgi:hypothetical protein
MDSGRGAQGKKEKGKPSMSAFFRILFSRTLFLKILRSAADLC